MTIVFASMEVAPYAFAGGLGNVMAELPKALARMGHRVIVVTPRHTIIDRNKLEDTGKYFPESDDAFPNENRLDFAAGMRKGERRRAIKRSSTEQKSS